MNITYKFGLLNLCVGYLLIHNNLQVFLYLKNVFILFKILVTWFLFNLSDNTKG